MQREKLEDAAASRIFRTETLARQFDLSQEEERKLKILFGEFLTKQEFMDNMVRPPRAR